MGSSEISWWVDLTSFSLGSEKSCLWRLNMVRCCSQSLPAVWEMGALPQGEQENAQGWRRFWKDSLMNMPFHCDPGSHLTEQGMTFPGLCSETPVTVG